VKILLVEPPPCSPLERAIMGLARTEPLALELIAGGLENRHDVELLDLRVEEGALEGRIDAFEPDLVATSAYTATKNLAFDIFRCVKQRRPEATTVIGGHHATLVPRDFSSPNVDFVVVGEGEETFQELVGSVERGEGGRDVKNVGVQRNGEISFNPLRPLPNLDDLPIARRSLRVRYGEAYFRGCWKPVASIHTSRGCPFRCRFCAMWKLYGGTYRLRSPEKVAEEVASLKESYIDFADDNTLQDPRHSAALARALGSLHPRKKYKAYARADAIVRHPDLVEVWRDAGLALVLVGFEAFRDEDLKRIRKGTTREQNEQALAILCENGVEVVSYFIVYPDFTREDFLALSEYIEALECREPVFTVLTPFPGTDYYQECREDLLTENSEQYDLMHSVLPTRLPQKIFYRELANLFRRAYGKGGPAEGRFPARLLEDLSIELEMGFRSMPLNSDRRPR